MTKCSNVISKEDCQKNIHCTAQSSHQRHQNCIPDIVLVSLLQTLNNVQLHYIFKI